MLAMQSRTLSPSAKPSQTGIRCSGTRRCSQRFEIDHFCQAIVQLFSLPKFFLNPVGNFRFYPSNVRYTYNTRLKLEKCSELEVGTF